MSALGPEAAIRSSALVFRKQALNAALQALVALNASPASDCSASFAREYSRSA